MWQQYPDLAAAAARELGDRFAMEELIRPGGQGVVLRARRLWTPSGAAANEEIALKLYFSNVEDERVEREIAAMQHTRHENLARLIEHGRFEMDGQQVHWVAWEYIGGQPLDARLARGPLPPFLVARIGRDVSAAVAELWGRNIVHRDIKPPNIVLRSGEMEAVLIDLGVARHLDESSLTAHGETWGTRGYMSPEQWRAERRLTCKSDMFALGVVLQHSLVGHHPTRSDQAQLAASPPPTAQIAPLTPGGLAELIDRCLSVRAPFRPDPLVASKEFSTWANLLES